MIVMEFFGILKVYLKDKPFLILKRVILNFLSQFVLRQGTPLEVFKGEGLAHCPTVQVIRIVVLNKGGFFLGVLVTQILIVSFSVSVIGCSYTSSHIILIHIEHVPVL